jgi:hypothetical protein
MAPAVSLLTGHGQSESKVPEKNSMPRPNTVSVTA